MPWKTLDQEKPKDGQVCMVEFKHGFIDAFYSEEENIFSTYIWKDFSFYGYKWMPFEEFKALTKYEELK
jgi:hypothetical protein